METLEGTVRRITFRNEENFYSVFRLEVANNRYPQTVVGYFPALKEGEQLKLEGEWVTHPTFGRQFKAEKSEVILPTTKGGLIRYLGSGLLRGIGPKRAEALVEHFGLDVLDVIKENPKAMTIIKGIDEKLALRVQLDLIGHEEIERFMIYLQGYEISPNLAMRIYRHYQHKGQIDLVQMIEANPYRLAEEVFGIGFRTADEIGQKLGVSSSDPKRIRAGLRFVLSEMTSEGHCFLYKEDLLVLAEEFLQADPEQMEQALKELIESEHFVLDYDSDRRERIYLVPFYVAETKVADNLRMLGSLQMPLLNKEDLNELYLEDIKPIEAELDLEFASEQIKALSTALNSNITIITGGPGTGKTTVVRAIEAIYSNRGATVFLAAPTGRAAKRLKEVTGKEAKTLHRLLEYNFMAGEGITFARNEDKPLACDVLIVDEASMIDIILFHHLLKALSFQSRLILIGDQDQLPSVGPGNVLKDLIASDYLPVVRLQTIFRQAEESLIVQNAHRINQGQMPIIDDNKRDFFFMEKEDPLEAAQLVTDLAAQRLPAFLNLADGEGVQVITPMRKGSIGVDSLNIALQERLNPRNNNKPAITKTGVSFSAGDKVMQIRNNYDKGIFNGDIGQIVEIDTENNQLIVEFQDGEGRHFVPYEESDLDELVLSYAITIHKSQGSEYPAVVIPLLTQHAIMLQRNLLYTGITRGKELVVVVGSKRALYMAVRNNDIAIRYTGLAQRLQS